MSQISVRNIAEGPGRRAWRTWHGFFRRHHADPQTAEAERGDSLVEFALTIPILLTFLLGLTEMCLGYYTYEWISEAAREGTRYAIVRGANCETSAGASCEATASDVNTYVTSIGLPNLGGGTMIANTTYPDGDEVSPHRVKVVVTYTFPYKIPWVTSSNISLTSTSEMYILQ
jgi:Flp pilus assembly protein TadG